MKTKQPTRTEMEEMLRQAKFCLTCDAPDCHEFTPEGVDVCASLPFYDGKPVTRQMLLSWQELVHRDKSRAGS